MQLLEHWPLWIMAAAFLWLSWRISKRIMVPVGHVEFPAMSITRTEGHVRFTDKVELKDGKPMPLYAGNNDFYVTIQKRKVKFHSRYVLDTITPIIRDAEDILFFRIQIRVTGGRVVKFNQTNLSQPNVTLQWSTKMCKPSAAKSHS